MKNKLLQILSPYGNWQHSKGNQLVDQIAAKKMINNSQKIFSRVIPIYYGHPDETHKAGKHEQVGRVERIFETKNAIIALCNYNDDSFQKIISGKIKSMSPRWEMQQIQKNDYRPIRLISVGLTNSPNIPRSGQILDAIQNDDTTIKKILSTLKNIKSKCLMLIDNTQKTNSQIKTITQKIHNNNVSSRIKSMDITSSKNNTTSITSLTELSKQAKEISNSTGEAYTKVFAKLKRKTKHNTQTKG